MHGGYSFVKSANMQRHVYWSLKIPCLFFVLFFLFFRIVAKQYPKYYVTGMFIEYCIAWQIIFLYYLFS